MITTVKPGAVDWTGDNPFIYLKTDPAGDWSTLAVYFRIALSPYGVGQAMLVLESPYQPEHTDARRLVLTDNPTMTRYLLDHFVKKFGLFRPCTALLDSVRIVDGAQCPSAMASRSVAISPGSRSWRAEMLILIVRGPPEWLPSRAALRHAVRITQLPRGTICPVRSAASMKKPGASSPTPGRSHRTSASTPAISLVAKSMMGW